MATDQAVVHPAKWIAAAAIASRCSACDAASIPRPNWDHTTYGSLSSSLATAWLTPEQNGPRPENRVSNPRYSAGSIDEGAFASASPLLKRRQMTAPAPNGFFEPRCRNFTLPKTAATIVLPKTSIKFVPPIPHQSAAAFVPQDPQIADMIHEIEIIRPSIIVA